MAANEVFRLPLRLRRLTLLLLRRETLPEVGAVPAALLLLLKALPRLEEALLSFKSVPETNDVRVRIVFAVADVVVVLSFHMRMTTFIYRFK